MEDFKITKLISLLKEFSDNSRTDNFISTQKVLCCLEIIERKISEWENPRATRKLISDREWAIISEEDTVSYRKELERLERMNKIGFSILSKRINANHAIINTSNTIDRENAAAAIDKDDNNNFNNIVENKFGLLNKLYNNNYNKSSDGNDIRNCVGECLDKLRRIFPQNNMNGKKNIWIMKPSGLSRGRGIKCVSSLNEILLFIKKNSNQYMVQKYIENPLLILGRKVFSILSL